MALSEHMQLKAEINKSLSKYFRHNKTSSNKLSKIDDIPIDSDLIGDMSMDKILKIAAKTTKAGSKVKPLEKVLMFLREEQAVMKKKKEKQKQKAIKEIIEDQKKLEKTQHEQLKKNISSQM
jgi:hypothetical protein